MSLSRSVDRFKLVILTFVGLLYSLSLAYLLPHLPNQLYANDFFARWYASKMLLTTGRGLYDWTNAEELAQITGWSQVYDFRFYYPANLLLLTAPLSFLPYSIALFIWIVFGLWALWLSMFILTRLLGGISVNQLTLLLLLMTTSVPVLQHTIYAQFNSLVALALVLTYLVLYHRHYFWAGILAGGMLFKPQVTLVPLFVFLLWSLLQPQRRSFWLGWFLVCLGLWAVPEILEPNWVVSFVRALSSYPSASSAIDRVWNPYQVVSLGLVLLTIWFTYRFRHTEISSIHFGALMAWAICLNALIMPIFGMLNIVLMGPALVILLSNLTRLNQVYSRWMWWAIGLIFSGGMLAFVVPLLVSGPNGWHITNAEIVYRFTLPVSLSLISLALLIMKRVDLLDKQTSN
jgi:hypothetical protein